MLGLGEKSLKARASQSRPVLGYVSGSIQPPCSRQRMCILVSARLQATAAPDAPAPIISTSTGLFTLVFSPSGVACLDRLLRYDASAVRFLMALKAWSIDPFGSAVSAPT